MASLIGGGLGALGGAGILSMVTNLAANMESATLSFETLIGDAQKARDLIAEIQQFAAFTPFDQRDIVKAGKTLLAFGFAADEVIPTLSQLGDVAAATGAPLSDIIRIFSQIKGAFEGGATKVLMQDLRELTTRGVPILKALEEATGRVGAAANENIDFATVVKAFNLMTSEGGQAFQGMERLATSLQGRISNLVDTFVILGTSMGNNILPVAKAAVSSITNMVNQVRRLDVASGGAIGQVTVLSIALGTATAATIALNASMRALGLTWAGLFRATAVLSGIGLVFIAASAAVVGLIQGVQVLVRWLSSIPAVQEAWIAAVGRLSVAWENFKQVGMLALEALTATINSIVAVINTQFGTSFASLEAGVTAFVTAIINGMSTFLVTVSSVALAAAQQFKNMWDTVLAIGSTAMLAIGDIIFQMPLIFATAGAASASAMMNALLAIAGFVANLVTQLQTILVSFFSRIGVIIKQALTGQLGLQEIKNLIAGELVAAVANVNSELQAGLAASAGVAVGAVASIDGALADVQKRVKDIAANRTLELAAKLADIGAGPTAAAIPTTADGTPLVPATPPPATRAAADRLGSVIGLSDLNKRLQEQALKDQDQAKIAAATASTAESARLIEVNTRTDRFTFVGVASS